MKTQLLLSAFAVAATSMLVSFNTPDTPSAKTPPAYTKAQIDNGKYLVGIMGCRDCHSPKTMTPQGPAPDMNRDLSGHPAMFAYLKSIKPVENLVPQPISPDKL